MKIISLLVASLILFSFTESEAQEKRSPLNTVQSVKLNKSPEALGISQKRLEKNKKATNAPINIALFATDKREEGDRANSDVIMVLSLNQETGKVKMASIMRDTYVEIEGLGMDKINAAYATGGPQLAIKTINKNFNLDISDYLNVDFYSAAKIVNALGGVNIEVNEEELPFLNNYLEEIAIYEKKPAIKLNSSGMQKLTGNQAVAYSRIRAVGNGDYERTERQRKVLIALFDKMKLASQDLLPVLATQILPNLDTSMSSFSLLGFAGIILNSQNRSIDQARFPLEVHSKGKRINDIWYLTTNLEATSAAIEQFID